MTIKQAMTMRVMAHPGSFLLSCVVSDVGASVARVGACVGACVGARVGARVVSPDS
jgi:hypothetical protein